MPSWAQAPASPEPTRIALRAARLFDGKSDRVLADAVMLIEGSSIQAVGTGLSIPSGARVIDLGDVTLLPGLIDAHSHLLLEVDTESGGDSMLSTVAQRSTAERALLGAKLGREMLEAGVTTVLSEYRDQGAGQHVQVERPAEQLGESPLAASSPSAAPCWPLPGAPRSPPPHLLGGATGAASR
jgi:imidazolonepropionase-like amidohydrolase